MFLSKAEIRPLSGTCHCETFRVRRWRFAEGHLWNSAKPCYIDAGRLLTVCIAAQAKAI
jgi:hypothetical protein